MYEQVEKTKENKSRSIANSVAQKKSKGKRGFGFVDNRIENIGTRREGLKCVQRQVTINQIPITQAEINAVRVMNQRIINTQYGQTPHVGSAGLERFEEELKSVNPYDYTDLYTMVADLSEHKGTKGSTKSSGNISNKGEVQKDKLKLIPKTEKIVGDVKTGVKDQQYSTFDRLPLFPDVLHTEDTLANDKAQSLGIKQGILGDCWLISAIGAVAIKLPDLIKSVIEEVRIEGGLESDGRTFRVKLFEKKMVKKEKGPGTKEVWSPISLYVDTKLPVSKDSRLKYGGKGEELALYLPLIEKAITQLVNKSQGYQSLKTGGTRKSFPMLTGKLPNDIQLDDYFDMQSFTNSSKNPMAITGKRKKKETDDFEDHDMVVVEIDSEKITILDQSSASKDSKVFTVEISKILNGAEVDVDIYTYTFLKISEAQV